MSDSGRRTSHYQCSLLSALGSGVNGKSRSRTSCCAVKKKRSCLLEYFMSDEDYGFLLVVRRSILPTSDVVYVTGRAPGF